MNVKTEGIVLKQVKAANGKRIIVIFSRQYGKISVGTHLTESNPRTKSALAIRPFTFGTYELFKNRGYYNYNSGEVKKSYFEFGEDFDKYLAASYVLELTDKALPDEIRQPRIFNDLLDFLDTLKKRNKDYDTLIIAYEIKLLNALGLMPRLKSCAECGVLNAKYFSVKSGGMICESCHQKYIENSHNKQEDLLIYSPKFDIVSTIGFFSEKSIPSFEKIGLDEKVANQLQSILRAYISYHLDIGTLKSENMLKFL